ncbi:ATP-binding protein [Thiospirillum jenense]|uniref:histidine kinase n=1 Tax=Thiospirillum jenense TaxID=1653858 RepID=A0A839HF95_9GAMM|nr:GHKL domain-containing protein [Thiospirillum jenense]
MYTLITLIYLIRIFTAMTGYSEANILGKSFDAIAFPIASILSAVFGNIGYLGVALDRSLQITRIAAATEARQIENQRLSGQIAHLDRQRSLCLLSTSLGHELNQPLTAILTHAQTVRRRLQRGDADMNAVFADLDRIAHNTQRASDIIARIRGFIRPVATHQAPVDVHQLINEVADLVAAAARTQQVRLHLPVCTQLVYVSGDAVQLSQVVLNILQNAMDAVTHSTQRDIFIKLIENDTEISLRIQDTGIGLTPEVFNQVGQPFFTTKATGLGMGFAIAQTITEQHGGQLTLTNAMPQGALAELTLPRLIIHSH